MTKRQRIAAWLKRERERAIVAAVTKRIAVPDAAEDFMSRYGRPASVFWTDPGKRIAQQREHA